MTNATPLDTKPNPDQSLKPREVPKGKQAANVAVLTKAEAA